MNRLYHNGELFQVGNFYYLLDIAHSMNWKQDSWEIING